MRTATARPTKPDITTQLVDYLVTLFDRQVLTDDGKPRYEKTGTQRALPKGAGMAGAAAAWLALTQRSDNPYFGREDLLDFAILAGDRLLEDHPHKGSAPTKPLSHFTFFPLTQLYQLAAGHAGARRLGRWRNAMAWNVRQTLIMVDSTWPTLGRPGPYAGSGPNHFFGWFSMAYRQAVCLEDDKAARRIESAMLRHMRLQAPAGYFPEHIGPVVSYHTVSMEGVAQFHQQRPLPQTRQALQLGLDYLAHAIYPDLRYIETFDERNRLRGRETIQAYLAWSGEGRAVLARSIEQFREKLEGSSDRKRPDWRGIAYLYRAVEQAMTADQRREIRPAKPLLIDRPKAAWRLEDKGLVRRSGPWLYALSAYANPTLPGNPFHLERTQSLSIFHDSAGVIVGGGNDKRSFENATIHIIESGQVHYSPPQSGELEVDKAPKLLTKVARCDRLRLDYGAAVVTLEIAAISDRVIRLAAGAWTNMVHSQIFLVLQLPLSAPMEFLSDKKVIKLPVAVAGQALEAREVGRNVSLPGKWQMKLPRGGQLLWPHFPWHTHGAPIYRVKPEEAVPLLRVPLVGPKWKVEVEITMTRSTAHPRFPHPGSPRAT